MQKFDIDTWLWQAILALFALGIVMVASSSLPVAERLNLPWYYFLLRHCVYVIAGLALIIGIYNSKLPLIEKMSVPILGFAMLLLLLVLVPGIRRAFNGSYRWLKIGFISLQPAELGKLAIIVYMASYLVRRSHNLHHTLLGLLVPLSVLGAMVSLLLLEPDFGTAFIIIVTIMSLLFLAGVDFNKFFLLCALMFCALVIIAVSSPYRVARFLALQDPWADPYVTGYQLVQSLIAFGRGGWLGVGLGNSVQKLLYLPEAHADFIFAIIAEELGVVGAFMVIVLYGILVWRGLVIARLAFQRGLMFGSFLSYGITIWLALQALINMAVNIGLLPTKGITLPLISAGGSSLLSCSLGLGLLLLVNKEIRQVRVMV